MADIKAPSALLGAVLRRPYALAAAAALGVVALWHMRPALLSNEGVYLIAGLMKARPGVLAADWFLAGGDADLAVVFVQMTSWLWRLTDDPVVVAAVARAVAWTFVVVVLARLARILGVGAGALLLAFIAWHGPRQGMVAGEWVLGGVEQKTFSYGFALLGLLLLLRGRALAAGLAAGAAFCLHVLVGAWSGLALTAAWAVARPSDPWRARLPYLAGAGLLGLPMAIFALSYMGGEAPAGGMDAAEIARIMVTARIPHHADPASFLAGPEIVRTAACAGASLLLLGALADPAHRRILGVWLGVLTAIFAAGVAARALGAFQLLVLYPFRVADAVLPLFGWLLLVHALAEWVRGRPPATLRGRVVLAVLAVLMGGGVHRTLAAHAAEAGRTVAAWRQAARPAAARPGEDAAYAWIAANTPADSVLLADPCKRDAWIAGRRALVLTYMFTPYNYRFGEWHERVRFMGGGKPLSVGGNRKTCQRLRQSLRSMPEARLREAARRFGATHYVVGRARADLRGWLVHRAGRTHVYAIPPGE